MGHLLNNMLLKDSFFPTFVYGKDLNLDNDTLAQNVIEWSKKDEGVKKQMLMVGIVPLICIRDLNTNHL